MVGALAFAGEVGVTLLVGGRVNDHGIQALFGEELARAHQKIAATLQSAAGIDAEKAVAAG